MPPDIDKNTLSMRILPKADWREKPQTLMSIGVPPLSMPIVSFTDVAGYLHSSDNINGHHVRADTRHLQGLGRPVANNVEWPVAVNLAQVTASRIYRGS
jgi:hypothetical protein